MKSRVEMMIIYPSLGKRFFLFLGVLERTKSRNPGRMNGIKAEYPNHRCQLGCSYLGCSFGKKVKSGGEIDLEGSQRAYNGSNHIGPNHLSVAPG